MTLRINLEIIPFGVESDAYVIRQVNISNLGQVRGGDYRYGVEIDKYKTKEYDFYVEHNRSHGAEVLASKVLELIDR